MNTCRDQGNPSLEDYGLASGNSETAVEATHDEGTMGACGGSVGSIMGGVGADAHAPSAPSNLVPDVPRPIPRCEICISYNLVYLILKANHEECWLMP